MHHLASQQVRLHFLGLQLTQVTFYPWGFLSAVGNNESEEIQKEIQSLTAQRRKELEHYLKLKRYWICYSFYLRFDATG